MFKISKISGLTFMAWRKSWLISSRVVSRSENPRGHVVLGGENVPPPLPSWDGVNWSAKKTLVTQPLMQRIPNCTELRLMDSYIQIVCRFKKSMQKVPPPSLLCTKNHPLPPQRMIFFLSLGAVKGDILVQGSDGVGTFCLLIWNLHEFGYKNPLILTPYNSVVVAS